VSLIYKRKKHFQTFTKYTLGEEGSTRGTQGKVFYLNNGHLLPAQVMPKGLCLNESYLNCTDAITVDSRTYRSVIAVNGQVPGPTIVVHENQTIVVDV